VLTRAPKGGLGKMGSKTRTALVERLETIAERPFARHRSVGRIKGERDAFRLRQGDWRAKYRIDRDRRDAGLGRGAGRERVPMIDVKAIRPLAENGDTVLLRRADYEALVREAEDAADAAQIRKAEARVRAGDDEYVPIELTRRLMAGEVPVRVWREHRGLSARTLAGRAGISAAYLSQIETGKKPGSFDAMAKLARALGVDMEDLEPWRT
jgi:DNA-binding Xre family transcriptional regulator/mRNA-degrading endonuclease RelE of RelBE toxin-antitoxin system